MHRPTRDSLAPATTATSPGARPRWRLRTFCWGPTVRGLHSSTFKLNLSAFYGIGVARRGCVAHVKGVLGGV